MLNTYPSTIHVRRAVEPMESITAEEAIARWRAARDRLRPKAPVVILRPVEPAPIEEVAPEPAPLVVEERPAHPQRKKDRDRAIAILKAKRRSEPVSRVAKRIARDRADIGLNATHVLDMVAAYYQVAADDIRGPRKLRAFLRPRNVAIFLVRSILNRSISSLAEFIGRDRSSVLNAIQNVEIDLTYSDRTTGADLVAIKKLLGVLA